MSLSARAKSRTQYNAWPGYVDVLSTLLMVIIFVLMVFVIAQFFLSDALSGRDQALQQLNKKLAELGELLSLERSSNADLTLNVAELSTELQSATAARDQLNRQLTVVIGERDAAKANQASAQNQLAAATAALARVQGEMKNSAAAQDSLNQRLQVIIGERDAAKAKQAAAEENAAKADAKLEDAYKAVEADKEKIQTLLGDIAALESLRKDLEAKVLSTNEAAQKQVSAEKAISEEARREVEILNRQLTALREQLAQVAAALDASEAKAKDQEVQIADLGKRLNAALANKVQELAGFRSEFFGRLRQVLGDRPDVRIVGDRFVFQSEVLFDSASAQLGAQGQDQLAKFAATLLEIAKKIPPDLNWLLRVDGHTDRRPISTPEFPSNWELSTARAISVVKFLESQGVSPEHLAATGFADYQPLDSGTDDAALARNRRIELKLDQR